MVWLYGAAVPQGGDVRQAAHALLGRALETVWGWREVPELAYGAWGKPFFPAFPDHGFNLSHTEGFCLCALSDCGAVGVDIERVRPRRAGLPEYVLSQGELAGFDGTWTRFYELWTQKEAYCKYLGRSILPPREIPAPPPVPYRAYGGEGWRAALCGAEPLPESVRWLDPEMGSEGGRF